MERAAAPDAPGAGPAAAGGPPAPDSPEAAVRAVAPGTELRSALDNILRAKQGALIVIGEAGRVDALLDGGFRLDCPFSGNLLYELSKLDGAIVLAPDLAVIRYANVQLQPDARVATAETGTRHRTAERVARQTGALVVAVSERRHTVTLYRQAWIYLVPELDVALVRASQALQVLTEHRRVFDRHLRELTALECRDSATRLDVVRALRYGLDVLAVAERARWYVQELGTEGRLLALELADGTEGVAECVHLVASDHHAAAQRPELGGIEPSAAAIAAALGFGTDLQGPSRARGYRALQAGPHLPAALVDQLVRRFGGLPALLQADAPALAGVAGVGASRAQLIHEHLHQLGAAAGSRGGAPGPG